MSKYKKQLSFKNDTFKAVKEFGGALNKSNPKVARPISTKKAMHLVLRSDVAKGRRSMLNFNKEIRGIVNRQAKSCQIKIYEYANVGNHLHILIYISSHNYRQARKMLNKFLRSVTGLIARAVLGAERGGAQDIQFWSYRPYTRVVEWMKGFNVVKNYIVQNHLEAIGVIPFQSRKKRRGFKKGLQPG